MINRLAEALIGFPHLLRRMQYPHMERHLRKHLAGRSQAWVLDIGAGSGALVRRLAGVAYAVGIEPGEQPAPQPGRSAFVRTLGHRSGLPQGFFDAVVLSSVLQMVPDEAELLSACHALLRPDGLLVLTVPTEYRYLPWWFEAGPLRRWLRKVAGLPATYAEFKARLFDRFGAHGRGLFTQDVLDQILRESGFEPEAIESAPRAWGTWLYEACLFLRCAWRRRPSVAGVTGMLLFPLAFWDRFLPSQSRGCELLLIARRRAT